MLGADPAAAQPTRHDERNLIAVAALLAAASLLPAPAMRVEKGDCPGYLTTCYDWQTGVATFANVGELRRSFYHEQGHAFDRAHTGLRAAFARIDRRPWTTPASEERFAQAYALCAQNRVLRKVFTSAYHAFRWTPAQHTATCHLIRGAA